MLKRVKILVAMTMACGLLLPAVRAAEEKAETEQKPEKPKRERRERREKTGAARERGGKGWALGVQTYTFNRFTFVESVNKVHELGLRFVEGFAWQKIGGEAGKTEFNYKADDAALEVARKALADAKVKLVSYYVGDFGKDEADYRKVFEFGKKMGIGAFVSEPKPEQLEALDKLAQEFKIKIAIHNHPKRENDANYTNWNPDNVMKLIADRSKMVGCCADTGHWSRSGLDAAECLKKYEGRLISLHLKDVNEKGAAGHDVPFGTGVSDVEAQLKELARQNFSGLIAIEYENHMEDNMADVRQSIQFYQKTAKGLGVRVQKLAQK